MNIFGEYLKNIITANQLSIYGIAQHAGIERTTISKIISSGRIPGREYVDKLVSALPISPGEKSRLMETYFIAKAGPQKYHQRMQVKQIIENISKIEQHNHIPQSVAAQDFVQGVVRGAPEVNHLYKDV